MKFKKEMDVKRGTEDFGLHFVALLYAIWII